MTKDIEMELGYTFNLKTDSAKTGALKPTNTNIKEIVLEDLNVPEEISSTKYYRLTGKKIGRVCINVKSIEGYEKNLWVEVVDNENSQSSSKVVNGDKYTVALRADGSVWSFGTLNQKTSPEKMETEEEIIDIASGSGHLILLGKSGTVYTIGANAKGQLGTGNVTTASKITKINLNNIEKVVAKTNTSFAIDKQGSLYAWGEGYTKTPTLQKITENVINVTKKYYLSEDGKVRKIADKQEIAIFKEEAENERIVQIEETDSILYCLSETGKIYRYNGNVTTVKLETGDILENIKEISCGTNYAIFTAEDGKVYTEGNNTNEKLGFSIEEITNIEYAKQKEDVQNIERVTAGYNHTAVYDKNGDIYTWGLGTSGELGNGEIFSGYDAVLVGKNIVETNTFRLELQKGNKFDIDGKLSYFNLFIEKEGNIIYEIQDQEIANLNRDTGEIQTITPGRTTVIAKDLDTGKISVIPLIVLEKGNIEPMVKTAGGHTLMLKIDGTVWSYGTNNSGELGIGNKDIQDEPCKVTFPSGTIIKQIEVGEKHSLALDTQGNVWAWGDNSEYQLGNSMSAVVTTPKKITNLKNIRRIACGEYNSFAIGKSGEIYSFGRNSNGEGGMRKLYK